MSVTDFIRSEVNANDILLFMKGRRSSRQLDKVGVKASCAEVLPRHTSPRKPADNDILPLLLHGGLQHLRKESLPSPLPILITQPRAVDDRTIGYDRIPFVTASRRVANE